MSSSRSTSFFHGPVLSLTTPEDTTFELLPLTEAGEAHSNGSTPELISPLYDDTHFEEIPLSDPTGNYGHTQDPDTSPSNRPTNPTLAVVSFLKKGALPAPPMERPFQPGKHNWRVAHPVGHMSVVIITYRRATPSQMSVFRDMENNYIEPIKRKIKSDIQPKIDSEQMTPTVTPLELSTWKTEEFMGDTKESQRIWETEGSRIHEEIKSNPNKYFGSTSIPQRDFQFEHHTAESFASKYPGFGKRLGVLDYDLYQQELTRKCKLLKRHQKEVKDYGHPTASGSRSGSGIENRGTKSADGSSSFLNTLFGSN